MGRNHYINVIKDGKEVYSYQVLGNDDSFDKEFYKNLNINPKKEDNKEINYIEFLYEWHQYLERNPDLKKSLEVSDRMKERLENRKEAFADYLFGFYGASETYSTQPQNLTRVLIDRKYLNLLGEPKDCKITMTII